MPFAIEQQPVSVMAVSEHLGILAPDDFDVRQGCVILGLFEFGAYDGGPARATRPAFDEAEVDQPVGGEARMQGDVAEPTLAAVIDIGYTANLSGYFALLRDDQEISLLFRHEHSTVRQESQRPGLVE